MYNPWEDVKPNQQEKKAQPGPPSYGDLPPVRTVAMVWGVAALFWLMSGFYQVDLGSVAIVLRLGRIVEIQDSGWHYHLPAPIERILRCNPSIVQQLQGGRASSTITGDRNLVDVSYTIQWRINDPTAFLFRIEKPESLIHLTAGACMRDAVNSIDIDDALAEGRHKIEAMVKANLQKALDGYESGIFVQEVTLRRLDPPKDVADAFYDVEKAWADHHHVINQAEALANEVIPQARAEATRLTEVATAQAYRVQQMADAEHAAFEKVQASCQGDGRIGGMKYLAYDALQETLSGKQVTIIDGQSGALPIVPVKALEGVVT